MWRSREPRYDVASAISQGARDYQEDAITSDFLVGADAGFIVLADGMGGHAAGDIASKIVLTEVYSELKFQYADVDHFEQNAPAILRDIADMANQCIRAHVMDHPETHGMGATLVAPVMLENRLFWISVGDSPLYRLRGGKLQQINEDHSMAPQIDFMVESGLMDPEVGMNHPDRNCLTSVMIGDNIPKIDCPEQAMELRAGDIIVCASDGLQFLSDQQIERLLHKNRRKRSTEIAEILLNEIKRIDDPDQDNVTFCIIKVNDATATPLEERQRRRVPSAVSRPSTLTTVIADPNIVQIPPKTASKPAQKEVTTGSVSDRENGDQSSDSVSRLPEARAANTK